MNWKLLSLLAVSVLLSAGLMMPAAAAQLNSATMRELLGIDPEVDWRSAIGFMFLVTSMSGLVAVFVGHALERRTGLGTPLLHAWLDGDQNQTRLLGSQIFRMLVLGVVLAVVILLTGFAFRGLLPRIPPGITIPPAWQGILMIAGAAIREEVLFRFGAVNLLLWLSQAVAGRAFSKSILVWIAIVATSLGFALAHVAVLPSAFELTVEAKLLGSAIVTGAGCVFGWSYWRYGLVAATVCHFATGIIVLAGVQVAMALTS